MQFNVLTNCECRTWVQINEKMSCIYFSRSVGVCPQHQDFSPLHNSHPPHRGWDQLWLLIHFTFLDPSGAQGVTMFVRSILVCLDLCKNSSLNQSSNKLSIFLAQVFVRSLSGLTLLRRTDGAKNTKIFLTFPPHLCH